MSAGDQEEKVFGLKTPQNKFYKMYASFDTKKSGKSFKGAELLKIKQRDDTNKQREKLIHKQIFVYNIIFMLI